MLDAYALGALDAEERLALERHLPGCADCRRRVADAEALGHLLPLALATASPLRPPPDLKNRVLHGVAMTSPVSRHQDARPAAMPVPAGATPRHADGSSLSRGDGPDRSPRWRLAIAAVALLALALSLAWGVRLSEALDQERALRESIASHFSRQQEIVLEVVDADDATRVILRSPDPDSPAYGKLFTRPDMPHVVAMAARLPAPLAGEAYHLWLTNEGRTFLAGVLPVNDQGFGLLTFDADQDGPVYEAARLTLQASGAEAPGGETLLAWPA